MTKYNDIKAENAEFTELLQGTVDNMFPDGVTHHGDSYFLCYSYLNDTDADLEILFELVRRSSFPNELSRFQSFFAVDQDGLNRMIQRLRVNPNEANIFEVEAENYSKHDMNLLNKGSNLVKVAFANLYWKGEASAEPIYEYLLKPPVKVIKKVSFNEVNKITK